MAYRTRIKYSAEQKSEMWDRWQHGESLKAIGRIFDVYFCDPCSPWQRDSNENTNGLLIQYLPSGTDISLHSQAKLNAIARQLNERPRKTLEYETPATIDEKRIGLLPICASVLSITSCRCSRSLIMSFSRSACFMTSWHENEGKMSIPQIFFN